MSLYSEDEDSEVELDVGGVRHVTSLATLRSHPGSMLDVMFSGNHQIEEEEGSGAFLDRDGSVFHHVWPISVMECWLSATSMMLEC